MQIGSNALRNLEKDIFEGLEKEIDTWESKSIENGKAIGAESVCKQYNSEAIATKTLEMEQVYQSICKELERDTQNLEKIESLNK